jgi:hypothetical protein
MKIGRLLFLGFMALHTLPLFAQSGAERFWLAGRYDGNRVVIYFEAVKFGDTFPGDAGIIAYPVADAFFDPMELRPDYIARFQRQRQSEHFAIGDRYDLLVGDGSTVTVTLTTLVGFASDEAVGNSSFIGALATTDQPERLIFSKNYYAVRRHVEAGDASRSKFDPNAPIARLDSGPVTFDIENKVAAMVTERIKTIVPATRRAQVENISPALSVQRFTLADGSTRYYVWAEWREKADSPESIGLSAWISPVPNLHIVAVDPTGGTRKQNLLNVVDLGNRRTGIIVSIEGQDSGAIRLVEYKDGAGIKDMRLLQSVGVAE